MTRRCTRPSPLLPSPLDCVHQPRHRLSLSLTLSFPHTHTHTHTHTFVLTLTPSAIHPSTTTAMPTEDTNRIYESTSQFFSFSSKKKKKKKNKENKRRRSSRRPKEYHSFIHVLRQTNKQTHEIDKHAFHHGRRHRCRRRRLGFPARENAFLLFMSYERDLSIS